MALQATLTERCLLYLLDRAGVGEDNPAVEKQVQRSISEALNARQAHVSRAIKALRDEECVRAAMIHVRGESRRKLAYFLTQKGVRKAREIRQRLEGLSVVVYDVEGSQRECLLREVFSMLPQRPKFSDLVAGVKDGQLDLRRFIAWQGRVYGGKMYDVREAITVHHFCGRAESLSRLDEFLHELQSRGFLLVGLPGVGKTALVSQWAEGLKGRVHVFWRCISSEMTARDLLHDLGETLHSLGRPALSDYLRRPSEDGRDTSVDLLKRDLSGLRFLIVLDNAHLAGSTVAHVVSEILRLEPAPKDPKVLLLARERVSFCTAEDRALGRVREEELTDLPREDALAMLTALEVEADRFDAILERCGGHPLSLELAAGRAMPLAAVRRTSTTRLVQEVLSKLDRTTRDTLAFAAVFERTIPMEILGGHSSELLRLCLLREEDGGRASMHDIVRESAIHGLNPARLRRLHVRAGEYLASSQDPRDALAATRQFMAGGTAQRAEKLAMDRGQGIIDAGLAESLLPLLDQLALSSRGGENGHGILLLRGNTLFAIGRWSDATRDYERCSTASDPYTAATALLGQGKAEVQRRSPLALSHLKEAEDRLEALGALRLLAEAQYWIGGFHEDSGRLDEARDAFEKGRAIAFSIGDRRWEGLCRYGIGRVRSRQSDEMGAADEKREALRLLEWEGCRFDAAKVCTALGGTLLTLGQTADAEIFISRAIAESRATGAAGVLASSLYNLASLRQRANKMKEAIPLLEEALGLCEQLEKYDEAAWCAVWIASEEWREGRVERGDYYASHAERLLSQTAEPALRVRALRNFTRAALNAGRKDDAERHLRRALTEAQEAGLDSLAADLADELNKFD